MFKINFKNRNKNVFLKQKVFLFLFVSIFYSDKGYKYLVKADLSNNLQIVNKPYNTTLSLGDELDLDGLEIKLENNENLLSLDGLTFSSFDNNVLGKQDIHINYNNYVTSFNVEITNKFVKNYIPSIKELFISEIAIINGFFLIEIYNGTLNNVNLNEYKITLDGPEETNISFINNIESKGTFILTNNSNFSPPADYIEDKEINLKTYTNLILKKNDAIIDTFNMSLFTESNPAKEGVFRRNKHISGPSFINEAEEWIYVRQDISNFGTHTYKGAFISIEEQAKAFAHYVMFGAGMFASERVHEAFLSLRSEFELMSIDAKIYFSENKSVKITGINERGVLETVTFLNAHNRISLLASKSNYENFILLSPKDNLREINFSVIILSILSIGAYLVLYLSLHYKASKNNLEL